MVLLVTVHRYIAVCHPTLAPRLTSVRAAHYQTAGVLVTSVIFNIPRFCEYTVGKSGEYYIREKTALHLSDTFQIGYKAAAYYILAFLLPMAALFVLTILLLRALHQGQKKRSEMGVKLQPSSQQLKEEITRALVVVVVVFLICQICNPLRRVLQVILPAHHQVCGTAFSYYSPLTGIAILFNSSVNFPIFCLCGQGFRKKTARKLCWWARSNTVEPSTRVTETLAGGSGSNEGTEDKSTV